MRHLISGLFILLSLQGLYAQDITGIWEAKANKSTWILNISNNGSRYDTRMDDPEHDLYGIATQTTLFQKDSLFIDISLLTGTYKGSWNQKDSIKGVLTFQGGGVILNFKRISSAEKTL